MTIRGPEGPPGPPGPPGVGEHFSIFDFSTLIPTKFHANYLLNIFMSYYDGNDLEYSSLDYYFLTLIVKPFS
jgi:hypothetical protein